jgi:hypothetical protein
MLDFISSAVEPTPIFFGSSRITGEVILDLHKEEFAVPVAVSHPFDDLDPVVNPF